MDRGAVTVRSTSQLLEPRADAGSRPLEAELACCERSATARVSRAMSTGLATCI